MLDAAYELFCKDGYRATTMEAIAERAGVAVQTLYFTFHTKDELFQAVHERTVLGDENVLPPMQPWYRAAVASDDVRAAVRHICRGVLSISRRVAPMIPAFHAVACDPAGDVWERSERLRHEGMVQLVDALTKKAPLRTASPKPTPPTCSSSSSVPTCTGRWCSDAAGPNGSSPTGPSASSTSTCSDSNPPTRNEFATRPRPPRATNSITGRTADDCLGTVTVPAFWVRSAPS